ncbi:hypothetical protein FKM82_010015 [Ascaphus truei]
MSRTDRWKWKASDKYHARECDSLYRAEEKALRWPAFHTERKPTTAPHWYGSKETAQCEETSRGQVPFVSGQDNIIAQEFSNGFSVSMYNKHIKTCLCCVPVTVFHYSFRKRCKSNTRYSNQ